MSPQQLQRVVVRMLYDPALVDAVYAGRPVDGLDADGRRMLCAVDRRAWGTDPYRRSRTLHALIEEYPASAAISGLGPLDAFFSSSAFHRCMQGRGALALAFGAWLAALAGGLAALELAMARARRPQPVPPGPALALAPGVEPVVVPVGTLARSTALRDRLGADPVAALVGGAVSLVGLPAVGSGQEHLLVERGADGHLGVSEGSAELLALCAFARRPRSHTALCREARRLGAEPGEDAEILDSLVQDGLLVPATER